jgi:hypothetical protein
MDVANVEAFVQKTIDRSGIVYSAAEREELLAEGLTILYELAERYKPMPARPGIDKQAGRFSGYAAMFLPRRLGDFWHKSHPNHRYVTDPETGKRGWVYGKPMLSLDGPTSRGSDNWGDVDRHLLHAKTIDAFCHAATVHLPCRAS